MIKNTGLSLVIVVFYTFIGWFDIIKNGIVRQCPIRT